MIDATAYTDTSTVVIVAGPTCTMSERVIAELRRFSVAVEYLQPIVAFATEIMDNLIKLLRSVSTQFPRVHEVCKSVESEVTVQHVLDYG